MGFAAVARVTEDRWIACAVRDEIAFGLQPGGELKVETTICDEIRTAGEPVVIDHVAEDDAIPRHPTPAMYGFQSYISMPIVLPDGTFFGTLCAIDPRPARLNTPETIGMFKLFADLIGFHLDAQDRLAASEAALLDRARALRAARAVHRRPRPRPAQPARLDRRRRADAAQDAAERGGARPSSASSRAASAAWRGLIDNVLDFARGRLGGGLALERDAAEPLEPVLEQVDRRAARRLARPHDRDAASTSPRPVHCDRARIAQLLSNLVGNALTHGAPDAPVTVSASTDDSVFSLSVANKGAPIPPAILERLFQPFFRVAARRASRALASASTSPARSPPPMEARWRRRRARTRRASPSGCRCERVGVRGPGGRSSASTT